MKTLNVKKVSTTNVLPQDIPALLDEEKIGFSRINTVNWTDYPYCPMALFRVAYTDSSLLLNYKVSEATVRAEALEDNGRVWEDSCVECFITPEGCDGYYNIECNCAGTVLVGYGKDRHDRARAQLELLQKVERWSSLGRALFAERKVEEPWEIALIVPFGTFFNDNITSMQGQTARANFYKCGDKLTTPHFLSWNPITAGQPDFHRPEAFGTLIME